MSREDGIILIGLTHRYFLHVSLHDLDINCLQWSSFLYLNHCGLFGYMVDNYCRCSVIHNDDILAFSIEVVNTLLIK